jgi:hypothetical protein
MVALVVNAVNIAVSSLSANTVDEYVRQWTCGRMSHGMKGRPIQVEGRCSTIEISMIADGSTSPGQSGYLEGI